MQNIKSIPYLGKQNNIIREYIIESKELEVIETDIYSFISNVDLASTLVVVDNKWLTWLDDIVFNYRDKKCYIHYWKYDIIPLDENLVKRDIYQYLIEINNTFYLRYNYEYCTLNINLDTELSLYNLKLDKRYKAKFADWVNETEFNLDKLYQLYVKSCFYDDKLLQSREQGRYYIDKFSKKLSNRELRLRSELGVPTFKNKKHLDTDRDYRDVRNYRIEELQAKYGIVETIDCYKHRRIYFDSYLYCIMRANILSNNKEFNKEFNKLNKPDKILKYGDSIKLIFKAYWKNDVSVIKYQTWMKNERIDM